MSSENLAFWLQHLDSLPSGLSHKSLEHLKGIASELGVLSFSGKVITVTGTNGKGSSIIFLESILLAAGLNTGAYISPHIFHYSERIRVNGVAVDEKTLCWAFALVEKVRAKTNIVLSYFEFTTLVALVIFKKQDPDVLFLEVGLGGRYDAVNILDSDIAVITTIAFDHTKILGNTRDIIGWEKAGIIRPLKPVICGLDMPNSVYLEVQDKRAELYCLDKDFTYSVKTKCWSWCFDQEVLVNLPLPKLPLMSAALALMAIKLLSRDFKISQSSIVSGLKSAFLPGRLQKLMIFGREVIFDVAHNGEAATLLAASLLQEKSVGRIFAVVSILKDKDVIAVLKPLVGVIDRWYTGIINDMRAAEGSQLSQCLQDVGVSDFILLPNINTSLQQAIAESQEKDKIVVFGSFYVVAEGLNYYLKIIGGKNGTRK